MERRNPFKARRRDLFGLLTRDLLPLRLLPSDVRQLDDQKIRRMQIVSAPEKTLCLGMQALRHEPLDGDVGVDDQNHRSRSSRISSVLSVWATVGVILAIRLALARNRRSCSL